jgi:hypothetical protein
MLLVMTTRVFLAPTVQGTKGWEADMCMLPLQQTNFMAFDETMTKLAGP